MLNLNESKETSPTKSKIINKKKEEDSSILNLFNCNYKIPKCLKGDKSSINFKNFEKK